MKQKTESGGCILYLDDKKAELVQFLNGKTDSKIWKKEKLDSQWNFEEISSQLSQVNEIILIGETNLNLEYRRWLFANNRKLAKKLIAILPQISLTSDLIEKYKNKYFQLGVR